MRFSIAKLSIFAALAGLGLISSAQDAFADAKSTVTVNCKAYTQTQNGTKIGSWTKGYCGALVTFQNSSTQAQLQRYVACPLTVGTTESTCSVTKTHQQLAVPNGFDAISEYAPELPNQYIASGAWYAYGSHPLRGVASATNSSSPDTYHRAIQIEHQLLIYY